MNEYTPCYPECSCKEICKECSDWLEHEQEKEEREMKELDRAVQDGTDIYPDSFY